jgi:hypothetical protein
MVCEPIHLMTTKRMPGCKLSSPSGSAIGAPKIQHPLRTQQPPRIQPAAGSIPRPASPVRLAAAHVLQQPLLCRTHRRCASRSSRERGGRMTMPGMGATSQTAAAISDIHASALQKRWLSLPRLLLRVRGSPARRGRCWQAKGGWPTMLEPRPRLGSSIAAYPASRHRRGEGAGAWCAPPLRSGPTRHLFASNSGRVGGAWTCREATVVAALFPVSIIAGPGPDPRDA